MFFTAPFGFPLYSPDDTFYSPLLSHSAMSSVPQSPSISSSVAPLGAHQLPFCTDDKYPIVPDYAPDLPIDDESFTALEKIYLFSRSRSVFHRLFIIHAMPSFLDQVTPADAVKFVLPLLYVLARDQDESVKEALAEDLNPIIWWFLTNCQLTADYIVDSDQPTPIALISVQAFTQTLCILLLSSNSTVCRGARKTIVNLLMRMRHADIREGLASPSHLTDRYDRDMDDSAREQYEQDTRNGIGLFSSAQRKLFEHEVLHRLVIGLGHLNEEDFSIRNEYEDVYEYEDLEGIRTTEDNRDTSTQPLPYSREGTIDFREPDTEQPAIGRLSSMSLIAAITASGSLGDDATAPFVDLVERIARDQAWFVRNEAAFALGALARVVPEEVVLSSLASTRLPTFEALRGDSVWNVRQSALFALPAILSQLSPGPRRSLALETILSLAVDEFTAVRTSVLEALGEVIYAFHRDPEGLPNELVRIFLGQNINSIPLNDPESRTGAGVIRPIPAHAEGLDHLILGSTAVLTSPADANSSRALICAFNFPAVAFTLGRARWDELRRMYLELATLPDMRVHRTLAASLGELAQIIGGENARRDLVGVWKGVVRSKDAEVRVRAIGSVELFVGALRHIPGLEAGDGKNTALDIVKELLSAWTENCFQGWREREEIAKTLGKLAELVGQEQPNVFRSLLKIALGDRAAAVRDAAVSAIRRFWELFIDRQDVLDGFRTDIEGLSQSNSYRGRMTRVLLLQMDDFENDLECRFIACQYPLVSPDDRGGSIVIPDDDFWRRISPLADDDVVDVRIGVARLVGTLCDMFLRRSQPVTGVLLDLVRHLSLDSVPDVRLYVPELFEGRQGHRYSAVLSGHLEDFPASSPISRPPPLSIPASSDRKHSIATLRAISAEHPDGEAGTTTSKRVDGGATSEA